MVKKQRKKPERRPREDVKEQYSWFSDISNETKQSIAVVISFAFSLIFLLSILGRAGAAGQFFAHALDIIFGRADWIVPIFFFIIGVSLFYYFRPSFFAPTLLGGFLFLVSVLGGVDILFGEKTAGYAGYAVAAPVLKLFDFWVALVIMAALFVVSFLLMLNISLMRVREEADGEDSAEEDGKDASGIEKGGLFRLKNILSFLKRKKRPEDIEDITVNGDEENEPKEEPSDSQLSDDQESADKEREDNNGFARAIRALRRGKKKGFVRPPLDLLEDDKGKPASGDIKANANIIKRTFKNFGVDVEMAEVNVGPSVTQYTLRPAEGVKLSRITALHSDLALALAAHPIRIEAPIPGRSLVGIEIPNRAVALVGIRNLVADPVFAESPYALSVALGRDVSGKAIFTALEKMPHMLIAGSTGSGKSVAIHGIMMSLLYKNGPDILRFLLVDPKRVELSAYAGIPHLLAPVITDAKKTIIALKWAASEMERRYELLSAARARDIASYQRTAYAEEHPMPFIVIIIDELADIIAAYPRELESSIVRLAQMSRAVGIHLIVSTQRPSVEVITGLIKANITTRIAFQVASQVDSRTILDMSGAEKLLGNGDMLFLSGDTAKPKRIQGSFVNEKEVRRVAEYIEEHYADYDALPLQMEEETVKGKKSIFDDVPEDQHEDELYGDAYKVVIQAQKASASYLQRRLRIGYARAARLLDILEEKGVIGPGEGAKPRDVYVGGDNSHEFPEPPDTETEEKIHSPRPPRPQADDEPKDDFFRTMQ
ncbi:MAG: DNA translocase FtsK [Candidatus Niyogibacteria bacterium]|nr:DNA translocase FtsK [Candidatus Niyogibacteria bacterium]